MKQWNIGNTTVRNPDRIKGGLELLSRKFLGKTFDNKTQEEFYLELKSLGLIESDPAKEGSKTHTARKWASVFNQLGLTKCWQKYPPIQIMAPGRALLNENILEEDIFLRQLLKLQLPSPIERGAKNFSVHPLFVVIKSAFELQKQGYSGLNRDEIAAFIQTTINDNDVPNTIKNIIEYKNKKTSIKGLVDKRRYFRSVLISIIKDLYKDEYEIRQSNLKKIYSKTSNNPNYLNSDEIDDNLIQITETGKGPNVAKAVRTRELFKNALKNREPFQELDNILAEHFLGTKANTLIDYSDTTVRYSMATGLFTINGTSLAIKQDRLHFVADYLSTGNPKLLDDKEFLDGFYNENLPEIPTDRLEFLKSDIQLLKQSAKSVGVEDEKIKEIKEDGKLLELKYSRKLLEDEILNKKEFIFYLNQKNKESIEEIKEIFIKIANREIIGGSDYYPAWAEWAVWRVLLAINTIANKISETHHFKIDSDLFPIHHAKAGVEDLIFHYEGDYIIPTEVTLNTGERQYAVEREPVQTHILYVSDEHPDKQVIGLFVAPQINPRTAQSFFKVEEWSNKRNCIVNLNIIPLTIEQLITFLPSEKNGCSNSRELRELLDKVLALKQGCSNGSQWLGKINAFL